MVAVGKELEWFCVVAWHLWHDRNNCVHGKEVVSVDVLVRNVVSWWERLEGVEERNTNPSSANHSNNGVRETIRWSKPRSGFIKLNIDGAIDTHEGVFGTGAVCRNDQGHCLGVLAAPGTGYLSPHAVEVMALVHGLYFCRSAGFTHIEIEGDAMSVFAALDNSVDDFSNEGALLDEAKVIVVGVSFLEMEIRQLIWSPERLYSSLIQHTGGSLFQTG
ncbi:hypothetical protein ACLB2K_011446 [Fragaria x ananassa]